MNPATAAPHSGDQRVSRMNNSHANAAKLTNISGANPVTIPIASNAIQTQITHQRGRRGYKPRYVMVFSLMSGVGFAK
jgi:hypothetical protein